MAKKKRTRTLAPADAVVAVSKEKRKQRALVAIEKFEPVTEPLVKARKLIPVTMEKRLRSKLRPPPTIAEPLPETEAAVTEIEQQALRDGGGQTAAANASDSSTSDQEEEKKGARRERLLAGRSRRRLTKYLDEVLEKGTSLTSLEGKAISKKTSIYYQSELDQFIEFADEKHLELKSDQTVDSSLVMYMNKCYFGGERAEKGEKVMASLLHASPEFGRMGARDLPRAWRCLKGWRKLTPGCSRRALPLAVWCALARRLCCTSRWRWPCTCSSWSRPTPARTSCSGL